MEEPNLYDPEFYKFGMFYYNKANPKVLVPKRNPGFGYTFNFANKWSYVFVAIILALAACSIIFSHYYRRQQP
jgi:uncharacterized membrane protein